LYCHFIICTLNLLGTDNAVSVANIIASTKAKVTTALFTGTFCDALVNSSKLNNVTSLITPIGIGAIGAVCNTTNIPVFNELFVAGPNTQPSSMPSAEPSIEPTKIPTPIKPELVTSSFIGFVSIVVLIGFLRFYPMFMSLFTKKKKKLSGHKYDVLVMINDDHEAVLENICHEDIAFFRRTTIETEDQTFGWMMNATQMPLEKRFEVQFFDKYELLNSSMSAKDNKDMTAVVPNSDSLNELKIGRGSKMHSMQMLQGMIIRVKLKRDKYLQDDRPNSKEFHSFSEVPPSPSKQFAPDAFVINDDSLNERMKQTAVRNSYRLSSPISLSRPSSSERIGAVSINMLRRRHSNSRSSKSSSSNSSSKSSEAVNSHQGSDMYNFHDEANRSEIQEEKTDDEYEFASDAGSATSTNLDQFEEEEKENSEIEDTLSEKRIWDFPSEDGHRDEDQARKVDENERQRKGSWRLPLRNSSNSEHGDENESLDVCVRRGSWRIEGDSSS
jgi:hypothetical protein